MNMDSIVINEYKSEKWMSEIFFKAWTEAEPGTEEEASMYIIYREHDVKRYLLKRILEKAGYIDEEA